MMSFFIVINLTKVPEITKTMPSVNYACSFVSMPSVFIFYFFIFMVELISQKFPVI